MINDNEHHQAAQKSAEPKTSISLLPSLGQPPHSDSMASTDSPSDGPRITENVKATLSPLPAPHVGRSSISDVSVRSSMDATRKSRDVRRSMDAGRTLRRPSHEVRRTSHEVRRSFSGTRHDAAGKSRLGDRSPLSPRATDSDSASLSVDPGTESSVAIQSMDESAASASQILDRSDLFRAPGVTSPVASPDGINLSTHSQDTTRSSAPRTTRSKGTQPASSPSNAPMSLGTRDGEYDTDASGAPLHLSGSSSALQDMASYPLQKASGLAGFFRTRSKKMSNLIAAESMGYYEKVSGMLAGGRKHYNTAEGLETGDQVLGFEDDEDATKAADNFREHFAFRETEVLQSSFFASLQRVLPNYGKIYISGKYFCFRSLMPTSKTKVC